MKPLQREVTWGSRRHVLNWIEQPNFRHELNSLLQSTGAVVPEGARWMPRGWADHREARLESAGPELLGSIADWQGLRSWWLIHHRRANTPNWDLAVGCLVGGRPGVLLVEAKAHLSELGKGGKPLPENASEHSKANDLRIRAAIEEARRGLEAVVPGTRISADSHYQLSNRLAFSWWLARSGVPVVLMYLGFTGDSRVGRGFADDHEWKAAFRDYRRGVLPDQGADQWIQCGRAAFQLISRSRLVPLEE